MSCWLNSVDDASLTLSNIDSIQQERRFESCLRRLFAGAELWVMLWWCMDGRWAGGWTLGDFAKPAPQDFHEHFFCAEQQENNEITRKILFVI